MYQNPEVRSKVEVNKEEVNSNFEEFYRDIFIEANLLAEVDEIVVCENHNDHMNGNVYMKFKNEKDAELVRDNFSSRWFNSKPIYCELSPVQDFRDSTCRQHDTSSCDRGNLCNFMHIKRPSNELMRSLKLSALKYYREKADGAAGVKQGAPALAEAAPAASAAAPAEANQQTV